MEVTLNGKVQQKGSCGVGEDEDAMPRWQVCREGE